MAIESASEFEAIINQLLMRVAKVLSERPSAPNAETAMRELTLIFQAARQPAKLKALRPQLEKVTELLEREIPNDNVMLEKLWDLADYIDYRA